MAMISRLQLPILTRGLLPLALLLLAGASQANECRPPDHGRFANECHRECRAEKHECRSAARDAYRSCREACEEGDSACRDACKEAKHETRSECRANGLDCAVDCRDDLDAACADVCVDEARACTDTSSDCRSGCKDELGDALGSCRTQAAGDDDFDKRACYRAAWQSGRECWAACHVNRSCRSGLGSCLDACVIEETPAE